MNRWTSLLLPICILSVVNGYKYFQDQIPNGHRVPSPSDVDQVWQGVGHRYEDGGGLTNPFGDDFKSHGHSWTRVCALDSDGDGRTNGQELGDPDCSWTPGSPSPSSNTLTHPGICEPINSRDCSGRNLWLSLRKPFDCPAIKEKDVLNIPLRLSITQVPARETTLICQGFYLPNDTDYDVIASTPIINNSYVAHHMLLYACKDMPTDLYETPSKCKARLFAECPATIGLWAYGLNGFCSSDKYGFHIGGRYGFNYAILEIHWNNPQRVADYVDSSGITLHYTAHLRPNHGQVLRIYQPNIHIPPGQPSVTIPHKCSSRCTSVLPRSIYPAEVSVHMHLLGVWGSMEVYRDGVRVATLINTTFDAAGIRARLYQMAPPDVEIRPGDEIRLVCVYNSTTRTTVTVHGGDASQEMCVGNINYYPEIPGFTLCGWFNKCNYNGVGCDFTKNQGVLDELFPSCNFAMLKPLWNSWNTLCKDANCSSKCRKTLTQLRNSGCLSGDVGKYIFRCSPNLQKVVKRCALVC